MSIRKIMEITLCIQDRHTYKVGEPYFLSKPGSAVVTRIAKERGGGYWVHNNKGGKTFFAEHYVDPESIVRG